MSYYKTDTKGNVTHDCMGCVIVFEKDWDNNIKPRKKGDKAHISWGMAIILVNEGIAKPEKSYKNLFQSKTKSKK